MTVTLNTLKECAPKPPEDTGVVSIQDEMKKLIGKRVHVVFNCWNLDGICGDLINIDFTDDGRIAIVLVKNGEDSSRFIPGASIAYICLAD